MVIRYQIEEMLKSRAISARELSRRSGVSTSTISFMKQQKLDRIDRVTLEKLCKALQCQVQDLMVYIPDPVPPAQPVVAEPSPAYQAVPDVPTTPPARKPRTPSPGH